MTDEIISLAAERFRRRQQARLDAALSIKLPKEGLAHGCWEIRLRNWAGDEIERALGGLTVHQRIDVVNILDDLINSVCWYTEQGDGDKFPDDEGA